MNYRCEDAAEALAAYALDALPAGERVILIEHLAECRVHDGDLAGYRLAASRLVLTVDQPAAPAGLKSSLLDAFDREQAEQAATAEVGNASPAAAEPEPPGPAVKAPRGGFLAIFRQPALAYGIAAALLIAVVGLAAWNMSLRDTGDHVITTAAAGPGMSLNVTYYPHQEIAVFDVSMPPPASGKVYQAWMIADGKPVSVGVLSASSGRQAFAANMSGASAVAISLEPPGGSSQPTSNPIVVADF